MGRVVASRRGLARGLGLLVAAVTLVVVVPTGAQAASSSEFVADINAARTTRGGHALTVKGDLNAAAQAQAERMADKSELYHNPNLGGSVSGWTMLAENVGYGPDVATIHAAFMASPGHRTNILNPKYTEVGIGVVVRDHVMWVAEVFRRPTGASSGSGSGSGSGASHSPAKKSSSTGSSSSSGGGTSPAKHPATPAKKAHPPKAKPVVKPPVVAVVPTVALHADLAVRQGPVPGLTVVAAPEGVGSAAGTEGPPSDLPAPAAAALGALALLVLACAARLRMT